MNVGSLFAGIGGFDLGFERAGMRTLWQVEQDPYCRAVLAQHFPDAERFEDVRDVGAFNLAPVDLICGGFPCQDLSSAGAGAGIDGARSGLWSEFARIIRELRPRYVVVENVPDLLAGRGKRWTVGPVSRVLGDLSACGYDAEWDCIPASAVGAPHQRDRIWFVAYPSIDGRGPGWPGGPAGGGQDGQGLPPQGMADSPRNAEARPAPPSGAERERARPSGQRSRAADVPDADGCGRRPGERDLRSRQPDPSGRRPTVADSEGEPERAGLRPGESRGQRGRRSGDGGSAGGDLPHAGQRGCEVGAQLDGEPESGQPSPRRHDSDGRGGAGWWGTEPDVGRVADGVPARVDRLAALGNALVPQIAEWIGSRILDFERGRVR